MQDCCVFNGKEKFKELCFRNRLFMNLVVNDLFFSPNVFLTVKPRPPGTSGAHAVEVAYDGMLDPLLEQLAEEGLRFSKKNCLLKMLWLYPP